MRSSLKVYHNRSNSCMQRKFSASSTIPIISKQDGHKISRSTSYDQSNLSFSDASYTTSYSKSANKIDKEIVVNPTKTAIRSNNSHENILLVDRSFNSGRIDKKLKANGAVNQFPKAPVPTLYLSDDGSSDGRENHLFEKQTMKRSDIDDWFDKAILEFAFAKSWNNKTDETQTHSSSVVSIDDTYGINFREFESMDGINKYDTHTHLSSMVSVDNFNAIIDNEIESLDEIYNYDTYTHLSSVVSVDDINNNEIESMDEIHKHDTHNHSYSMVSVDDTNDINDNEIESKGEILHAVKDCDDEDDGLNMEMSRLTDVSADLRNEIEDLRFEGLSLAFESTEENKNQFIPPSTDILHSRTNAKEQQQSIQMKRPQAFVKKKSIQMKRSRNFMKQQSIQMKGPQTFVKRLASMTAVTAQNLMTHALKVLST